MYKCAYRLQNITIDELIPIQHVKIENFNLKVINSNKDTTPHLPMPILIFIYIVGHLFTTY